METRIIQITTPEDQLGHFAPSASSSPLSPLTKWIVPPATASDPALSLAAQHLRETSIPVAFPTETVYGLGADATRSAAVKGIYAAKGRPSDNPLIVHVCDLDMLRNLLRPTPSTNGTDGSPHEEDDPIPAIYHPLISTFWPGPLTILLPMPNPFPLAPEVTAGLHTFGARLPASPLARSLISLANAPLAAPSANASTRPSPTSAQHVYDDLAGKIALILDSGEPCGVGVESTVVDGLCDPPVVLRPGGVGIDEIRRVEGWEGTERGYKDGRAGEAVGSKPRAPGMKYKHYSPRARVVLYEAGGKGVMGGLSGKVSVEVAAGKRVGVIRTGGWERWVGVACEMVGDVDGREVAGDEDGLTLKVVEGRLPEGAGRILDLDLGEDVKGVAHGLFSALRELDRREADVILVEGVGDGDGIAAAVMNRLRKAASVIKA